MHLHAYAMVLQLYFCAASLKCFLWVNSRQLFETYVWGSLYGRGALFESLRSAYSTSRVCIAVVRHACGRHVIQQDAGAGPVLARYRGCCG